MTTLTALARPRMFLQLTGPMRRGFLLGFLGALVVALFGGVGLSAGVGISHAERIMPGVSVAGVPLGGLSRAEAAARLEASLPSLVEGTLTVSVDGEEVPVPVADLGRGYDIEAMLDAAFAVARSGNPIDEALDRIRVLAHTTELSPVSGATEAAIDRVTDGLLARFAVAPIDGFVTLDPERGFVATPATEGAELDRAEVRAALAELAASPTTRPVTLAFETRPVLPNVTSREASAAAIAANWMASTPLTLDAAGRELSLDAAALAGVITFGEPEGTYTAIIDEEKLTALIQPLAPQVATAARNAGFSWNANGIAGVIPGEVGRELDVAASVQAVADALRSRGDGSLTPAAGLAVTVTQPALTTEQAQAALPKMQRISTWTTYYVPGENNAWNANIHIPARDLDGMVLAPGEWFDFWEDIGPVTTARGYGYGGVIINGRSYPTGALAGGICSTSTTLFNAAMRAGLEIGDRTNHSYYIERYPVGLDATVLKTDTSTTTMTFRNDTENPIVIRSYMGSGWVRFDLWGVPDGRTVKLSKPVTSNHRAAIDTRVVNPKLQPGTSVRVESPHNGFDAVVTRWVYDAGGDLLHENVWVSHYRVVNGIVEVGPTPKPEPPDPPDEPDDPGTNG
ncbi:MAG TPA: VanW family protein [candidate division Zixibacteria bacterium]|nr:VanW family protein [candidate division Zixibacteria bacterium]